MGSFLCNSSIRDKDDSITEAGRCQTVRNKHRGFPCGHFAVLHVDIVFCNGIQSRSRLIQNEYRTVLIQRSCKHQPLGLTTGEHDTIQIDLASNVCFQSSRELLHRIRKPCLFQAVIDFLGVDIVHRLGNTLSNCSIKDRKLLEHRREQLIILLPVIIPDILSVQKDSALCGVIEATKELYERCLTGTVQANNSKLFTGMNGQVDILKDIFLCSGVTEGHILQPQLVAICHRRLHTIFKFEGFRNIQVLLNSGQRNTFLVKLGEF